MSSSERRGAVVPLVAISLVGILGLAALSVDAGNLYRERRNTQTAADASADAAAVELLAKFASDKGVDADGEAVAAAKSFAAAHGYHEPDVTVHIPPVSGAFAGKNGYVEVIIKTHPPRFFSAIFGKSELEVRSRAVAAGVMIPTQAGVLVLDPKAKNALRLKGGSSALEVGGDVIVNSNSKRALVVSKKGQLKAENVLLSGGIAKNSKGNIDADVKTGLAPAGDPWQSTPKPPRGPRLDTEDFKTGDGVYNLQPGTYKQLKFNKNDTVHMAPGVYVVDGGGFELKGNASLEASRVMIFNSSKRGFKFATKGNVSISPPRSGIYNGISLFQDPAFKTKVEFNRQTHTSVHGVIYAPASLVKFQRSDVEFGGGDEDDEDWDGDDANLPLDDYGMHETLTMGASIVARKLSIGAKTQVIVTSAGIPAFKPLLGVVE